MNETKAESTSVKKQIMLAVILFAISLVAALALGLVNHITKDAIAQSKLEKTAKARSAVLSADSYEPVSHSGGSNITGVYQALTDGECAGWVVELSTSGFGGAISMVVGIDTEGVVTGVSIVSMAETPSLGANAAKESFRSQYIGKFGRVALTKNGGEINALTGATVTSAAVTHGVNAALAVISEFLSEDAAGLVAGLDNTDAMSGATVYSE